MHLGLAGRPPGCVRGAVFRPEYEAARGLGLPVSYHANSNRAQGELRMIRRLAGRRCSARTRSSSTRCTRPPASARRSGDSGTSVSLSPWSELLIGYGVTAVKELLTAACC